MPLKKERARKMVTPIDLERMARSITNSYGDKGAMILVSGDEGTRIGVWGLTGREAQDALNLGTYYNMRRICEGED